MKNKLVKIFSLLALVATITLLTGCSGTVKRDITQTVTTQDTIGNPVTVTTKTVERLPKDIAFMEVISTERKSCIPKAEVNDSGSANLRLIKPMELKTGAAQIKYMDAVNMSGVIESNKILANALVGDPIIACNKAVTDVYIAYFKMEAQRSSNRWNFGKFLAGATATYLAFDSVAGALVSAGAAGDTAIGEVNISGNSAGGTGGEGAGGLGGDINQNISLGNGSLNSATDGGNINFGRNPVNGKGTVYDQDNIQPSTGFNF